jgi:nucleoside-diphosphate-sugar epimerase
MSWGGSVVTGASGFVGNRLIDSLRADGEPVRAVLRSYARAARLARHSLELIQASLTDEAALTVAFAGARVVYHCAHDFTDPDVNLQASQAIAQACLTAGVERLVFISSFAVYQPFPDGPVTEETPSRPNGEPALEWRYQDAKIAIERALLERCRADGLPVVILQPTIIYGPFGGYWTNAVASFVREGEVYLPSEKDGLCNAVYIDDVVQALRAAGTAEGVIGERFLIGAGESVGWRAYFKAYEEIVGRRAVVLKPSAWLQAAHGRSKYARMADAFLRRPADTAELVSGKLAVKVLPPDRGAPLARKLDRKPAAWKQFTPDPQQTAMFKARPEIDISKARQRLDYAPRYDFERGMAATAVYLRWANRL